MQYLETVSSQSVELASEYALDCLVSAYSAGTTYTLPSGNEAVKVGIPSRSEFVGYASLSRENQWYYTHCYAQFVKEHPELFTVNQYNAAVSALMKGTLNLTSDAQAASDYATVQTLDSVSEGINSALGIVTSPFSFIWRAAKIAAACYVGYRIYVAYAQGAFRRGALNGFKVAALGIGADVRGAAGYVKRKVAHVG